MNHPPPSAGTLLSQGIEALRGGDRPGARALLLAATRATPADPQAWLWLSGSLDDPDKQRYCLERALSLDPQLDAARRGLGDLEKSEVRSQKSEGVGAGGAPALRPDGLSGGGADSLPTPDRRLPHHAAVSPPSPARGRGGQGVRAKSAPQRHESPRRSGVLSAPKGLPDGGAHALRPGGRPGGGAHALRPDRRPGNPWRLIWARPELAMDVAIRGRSLAETGTLAALAGVGGMLAWADLRNLGDLVSMAELGLLALIGGPPLGLACLLIGGVLLRSGGRWLGGVAGAGTVRAALAWATAPGIVGLLIWLAQLTLLPAASFSSRPAPPVELLAAAACGFAHSALALWSFGLSLVGLGVAHRFSMGRAAASWLLAALIVVVAAASVFFGSAFLIALRGG